jgi:hypothetical protein
MKKFVVILAACLFTINAAFAQCDSSFVLHTIKQEMLNEKDSVVETQDDAAKIDISTNKIVITKDNGENILSATIIKKDCKWKEALKDGKTTYDISLIFPDGNESTGTAWLEGKDGKLHFVITFERLQGKKIKAYIDKM